MTRHTLAPGPPDDDDNDCGYFKCGQKALPVKHKEVHWLNLPPIIMTCFYFISSFLTEKLRKRLYLHKNLDSLHDAIPAEILPKEYGGRVPWQEMSHSWITKLGANRERLILLDKMRWSESANRWNPKPILRALR